MRKVATIGSLLLLCPVACSPPDGDPCAGIDCGPGGSCVVIAGAATCQCGLGYEQIGSRCVLRADGGLDDGGAMCGNGVAEEGELCDGEDLKGTTCVALGLQQGGVLACHPSCQYWDASRCITECGDNIRGGSEECDNEDLGPATCLTLGYYGGTLGCLADCRFDTTRCTGSCGDDQAQTDHGESCDGTDLLGATCESLGYWGGDLACTSDCQMDTSACIPWCGNGLLDPGEVCDDGNNAAGDACAPDCSAGLGQIVFVSNRDGGYELYTMLDDGTNVTQITADASDSSICTGAAVPRWSPDGELIAYRSGGDAQNNCPTDPWLAVVTRDGSWVADLVQAPLTGSLTWTRDGTAIIYGIKDPATDERQLRIVTLASGEDSLLFDGPDEPLDPDQHPFVDRVAYSDFILGGSFGGIFALTDATPVLLVDGCATSCGLRVPRWSSNGRHLLFHRNNGNDFALYRLDLETSTEATVLASGVALWADWVNDTQIVFQERVFHTEPQIVLVNRDGSDRYNLTVGVYFNGYPDWHPGRRDSDLDGLMDWEDNCISVANPDQLDDDQDGIGNACDN